MMKIRLKPTTKICLCLLVLNASIIMLADIMGLTPSKNEMKIDARKQITKIISTQILKSSGNFHSKTLEKTLNKIINDNEDLESIAVVKNNGYKLLSFGKNKKGWINNDVKYSSDSYIKVPVLNGKYQWATIHLKFKDMKRHSLGGLISTDLLSLVLFFSFWGYILYYIFFRRLLSYLDPSQVIPDRVRSAMDAMAEGVLILDQKLRIVLVNTSFSSKMNVSQEVLIGQDMGRFEWLLEGKNKNTEMPWEKALKLNEAQRSIPILFNDRKNNQQFTYMVNCNSIDENGQAKGVLITFDDVSLVEQSNAKLRDMLKMLQRSRQEIQRQNRELEVLATTDPLTDCLNRRVFFSILDEKFKDMNDPDKHSSVIMLDIDFFKTINDTYGHQVGDIVIVETARILKTFLGNEASVCRYGGEEFCVFLDGINQNDAYDLAEVIRLKVEEKNFGEGRFDFELKVTCSLGISDTSVAPDNYEHLIDMADKALYYAKETGRNKVQIWQEELSDRVVKQESKDSEKEGDIQHYIDSITGLPIRNEFIHIIEDTIEHHSTTEENFCLIVIDINSFRKINRSYGHHVGDALLKEFSSRLLSCLRTSDAIARIDQYKQASVSRLSGDLFGVLLPDIHKDDVIQKITSRIHETVTGTYFISDTEIQVKNNIGVSIYPSDGKTADVLLNNAERALTKSKSDGRNKTMYYDKELSNNDVEILLLENELEKAIGTEQLILYYQPKINLKNCEVEGVEALLRWRHPKMGLVSPGDFIPVAEESGLIVELGYEVFEKVCQQVHSWNKKSIETPVAVNLSAKQFKEIDLAENLIYTCQKYSIKPELIELEITETVFLDNLKGVAITLEKLSSFGFSISLDDFGVGYSSLNYIKNLPFDRIKIDCSFVQAITQSEVDYSIVRAIVAMGHALGLKVTGEGVEDYQQLNLLMATGCDEMQGFLFSRPVPMDEVTELLLNGRKLIIDAGKNTQLGS